MALATVGGVPPEKATAPVHETLLVLETNPEHARLFLKADRFALSLSDDLPEGVAANSLARGSAGLVLYEPDTQVVHGVWESDGAIEKERTERDGPHDHRRGTVVTLVHFRRLLRAPQAAMPPAILPRVAANDALPLSLPKQEARIVLDAVFRAAWLETLTGLFEHNMVEAAARLNMCKTTLKRVCREHGIARWPKRKLNKVARMIKKDEELRMRTAAVLAAEQQTTKADGAKQFLPRHIADATAPAMTKRQKSGSAPATTPAATQPVDATTACDNAYEEAGLLLRGQRMFEEHAMLARQLGNAAAAAIGLHDGMISAHIVAQAALGPAIALPQAQLPPGPGGGIASSAHPQTPSPSSIPKPGAKPMTASPKEAAPTYELASLWDAAPVARPPASPLPMQVPVATSAGPASLETQQRAAALDLLALRSTAPQGPLHSPPSLAAVPSPLLPPSKRKSARFLALDGKSDGDGDGD